METTTTTADLVAAIGAAGADGNLYEARRTLRALEAGTVDRVHVEAAEAELHRAVALVADGAGLHEDTIWDVLHELV